MGILTSGLFGNISGRVGNMVYYQTKSGRQGCRALPRPSRYPATTAQIAQRARFGLAISFLRSFRPIFNILPPPPAKKQTPFNWCVKQVLSEAITGDYPDNQIRYSQVRLYHGQSPSAFTSPAEACPRGVNFSWEFFDSWHRYTRVILLAYISDCQQLVFDICRLEKTPHGGTLNIPGHLKGITLETWLIFITEDGRVASSSTYTGQVKLQ